MGAYNALNVGVVGREPSLNILACTVGRQVHLGQTGGEGWGVLQNEETSVNNLLARKHCRGLDLAVVAHILGRCNFACRLERANKLFYVVSLGNPHKGYVATTH